MDGAVLEVPRSTKELAGVRGGWSTGGPIAASYELATDKGTGKPAFLLTRALASQPFQQRLSSYQPKEVNTEVLLCVCHLSQSSMQRSQRYLVENLIFCLEYKLSSKPLFLVLPGVLLASNQVCWRQDLGGLVPKCDLAGLLMSGNT
jgi:hypothetical protein